MNSVTTTLMNKLLELFPGFSWEMLFILVVLIPGTIIFLLMTINAMVAVYFERKVSAFMQDRLGPMEVGIFGFKGGKKFWGGIGQTIADAIKLLVKEDTIPADADSKLMILAPFIIFTAAFLTFVGVPFSEGIVISNFNIGILYILAMGSVGVVGIILAGWSSNNKWSLYGAMRSAAQIISYEIPAGLTVLLVVLIVGSLNLEEIVKWQYLNRWLIIHSPFTLIGFFIFFTAALAETNRAPFDMPEAESELVAGWMTEYSGFRWALFFLSEYAHMLIISIIASILFLGGWLSPVHFITSTLESITFGTVSLTQYVSYFEGTIFGIFWIFLKAALLIFLMMWVRWTFPRLRVDQLMYLCWKVLIPFSMFNLILVSIWELIF